MKNNMTNERPKTAGTGVRKGRNLQEEVPAF